MTNQLKSTAEGIIKAKAKLENDILAAVQRSVAAFKADTGLTPSGIYIRIQELHEFGALRNSYVVTDVEASVTL